MSDSTMRGAVAAALAKLASTGRVTVNMVVSVLLVEPEALLIVLAKVLLLL